MEPEYDPFEHDNATIFSNPSSPEPSDGTRSPSTAHSEEAIVSEEMAPDGQEQSQMAKEDARGQALRAIERSLAIRRMPWQCIGAIDCGIYIGIGKWVQNILLLHQLSCVPHGPLPQRHQLFPIDPRGPCFQSIFHGVPMETDSLLR